MSRNISYPKSKHERSGRRENGERSRRRRNTRSDAWVDTDHRWLMERIERRESIRGETF